MKQIFFIVLSIPWLFGNSLLAQSQLALSSGSAPSGSATLLNLTLSSPAGSEPAGLEWTLNYPAGSVTGLAVTAGPALTAAAKTLNCANSSAGYICLATGINTNVIANGIVATVSITLASTANSAVVGVSGAMGAALDGGQLTINGTSGTANTTIPSVLSGLSCTPSSLAPGRGGTCTLTLTSTAASAVVVGLKSTNTGLGLPAAVTVSAGSMTTTFPFTSSPTINGWVIVSATLGTVTRSAQITVSTVLLTGLACAPASLAPAAAVLCTVTMSCPVPSETTIAVSSTGTITAPATVSIAPNASSATFNVTAGLFTVDQPATVTASLNAVNTTANLSLIAPISITSLQCGSSSLAASASTTCTLTISKAAPTSGTTVYLCSSLVTALTVPASVLVPFGATTAIFAVAAAAATTDQNATVTASFGASSALAAFSVIAPISITSLQCGSSSLAASASTPCTVTISKAAPTNGTTVSLSSSLVSALTVPASVLVPAGATNATFIATATATAPDSAQSATVTATLGASSKSVTVEVTAAATTFTSLSILGRPSEVSGATNGSIVTPTIGPAGLTGTVVVKGSGAVKFAPDQTGNGVYFESCCANVDNAYYHFTGAALGSVFTFTQGQISFSLTSRYNLQQRATASSYRAVLDERDNNPSNHMNYYTTQVISGRLVISYVVGGTLQYYYVPAGAEDQLFGSGVALQVSLIWTGNTLNLYLNGALAKSSPYTPITANWTSASVFDLGAYEYLIYGGYDSCDDVIGNFTVGTATQH